MKPTLLVMAAGMGSRYGGVKQIDAVGMHGETLLDFGVYDAFHNGYGKVVFIIRRDIEQDFRERLFDRIARNMDAEYVFQERTTLLTAEQAEISKDRKKPWGTIQAILAAKDAVRTPFTVINADDYYGRTAYRILGDYLSTLSNDDTHHAMVGYKCRNTMSLSGSVTRAICVIKDGNLVSMEENPKIEFEGDKVVTRLPSGDVYLTGDEPVSMNFFGFTPKAFDSFMASGEGSIKVFTTPDKWFGMTYSEDKAMVMAELRKKIETGYYPEKLWER